MIVSINDDFDLERIAESGQCFRWEKTDDIAYRIIAGRDCLYVSDLGNGRYEFDCSADAYTRFWKNYFDLQTDYRSIRERIDPGQDSFMWRAAEHEKGIRILRQDPWETLVTFIISQNKNIPAIRRSVELLSELCGVKKQDSRGREYYAFPDADTVAYLSNEELMSCKLGYRAKYVQAASEAVSRGEVDFGMLLPADDDTATAALTELPGVGRKVANCVSLFGLHHINAFPIDVWIKRILASQYPDGYPYEKYAPYNGIYQQYMFAYYRNKVSKDAKFEEKRGPAAGNT